MDHKAAGATTTPQAGPTCGACAGPLVRERRTVVTQPGDAFWPQDVTIMIERCASCGWIIGADRAPGKRQDY